MAGLFLLESLMLHPRRRAHCSDAAGSILVDTAGKSILHIHSGSLKKFTDKIFNRLTTLVTR